MSPLRAGRPEAAAAIWSREPAEASAGTATRGQRIRGLLQATVGASIGLLILFYGPRTLAFVVLGMSSLAFLGSLLAPSLLQNALTALGRVTGRAVTWALMVPLFYLFFLPFGALRRRGRRDRLRRFADAGAESYWEPMEGYAAASDSLERQY